MGEDPAHPDRASVRVPVGDLAPGGTRLFEFERSGRRWSGFIVEHQGELHAWVNRCPHATFPLDLGDGDVLDPRRKFLHCHVHGAMFLPESGECFWGPAYGYALERLPVRRDGDELVVTIPPEPEDWP